MLSKNLLELSELAAYFLRSLTGSKQYSYNELAKEMRLTRNVLYYFAAETGDENSQSSSIKLNAFSNIISWLDQTDLEKMCQTERQKQAARMIKSILSSESGSSLSANEQFMPLLKGFELDDSEVTSILEQLPTILVGIRQRGSTKLFQISVHRFQKSTTGNAIAWDMTFLQGQDPSEGTKIPRHRQEGVSISGFAIPMENTLTCVGRLQKQSNVDHNLAMMNIIVSQPVGVDDGASLYEGSFYGYSRREAISRHMLFVSSSYPANFSPTVLSGLMGDVEEEVLDDLYPEALSLLREGVLGFSVGMDGKKVHYLNEEN